MEQVYKQIEENEDLNSLREQLVEQKNSIEKRIKSLEKKGTKDKLSHCLNQVLDISDSLIPLQESLNIVWKRTHQLEEELKHLMEKHQ